MLKPTSKLHKQLTQNQLDILRLLYRYRFASRDLIATYLNKKDMYRQLLKLEDRELIGKRYEPSYRLAGKPAAYYLKPDGMRELQKIKENLNNTHIKRLYVAKQASEIFVNHCMAVLAISLDLRRAYPTTKFFTKTDLKKEEYSYFPPLLPDAYIRMGDKHYFLNYIDNSKPFFTIVRWLHLLKEYYDNGTWDDTGTEFPTVLIVLDDQSYVKRLTKFIEKNIVDIETHITNKAGISILLE